MHTEVYAQANAGALTSLPQQQVIAALKAQSIWED
jgi:hypothetical protein